MANGRRQGYCIHPGQGQTLRSPASTAPVSNGTRIRTPRVIFRHGGACPRRAMFATRTPPNDVATPPRSSPPWSDVPGKTLWKHRSTRTSRMVARGRPMPHSGCEHSSTEASSVVGGASLSQRKSLSKPLTSCHSTPRRWNPVGELRGSPNNSLGRQTRSNVDRNNVPNSWSLPRSGY